MKEILTWVRRKLRLPRPPAVDAERWVVDDIIRELDRDPRQGNSLKNRGFVRRLRETVFSFLQRQCEDRIWEQLIALAEEALAKRQTDRGWAPKSRWSLEEIGAALGGVDPGTICNVLQGKGASISLARLLATLLHLERHWAVLGELPTFEGLRHDCLRLAIGFAQAAVNARFSFPPPPTEQPSVEQVAMLIEGFLDTAASPTAKAAWDTWGVGWLITKHKLGLVRRE